MTNISVAEQSIENAVRNYVLALSCPYDWWADKTISDCEPERIAALEKVVSLGETAIEKLVLYTTSEFWFIRQGVAKAMGLIKSKKAVEHLMRLLEDNDRNVRNSAYTALEMINQVP